MLEKWITTGGGEISMVLLSALITYMAIVAYTRVIGLRSFSKLSAADFAMTVAVGSLFASTISAPSPPLLLGLVAIASLFVGQAAVAFLRFRFDWFCKAVDNQPLLLMSSGDFLDENLRRANVTRADIYGKLREANAFNYREVRAVIFETTGDISVLHSSDAEKPLEPDFFKDVQGAEHLF